MGIDGLPKLIKDTAGKRAMKAYDLIKFKGMTVAVDASLMIYQTVIALRSTGHDLKNKQGGLTSHLNGLFFKVINLLEHGIKPIFVFDGAAPEIKSKTLKLRKERKEAAQATLTDLTDSEDETYIKKFRESFKPTKEDYEECRIMLDLMGIPYIIAPGEADVVCAWLALRNDNNGKKYVKGVCSDDSDMLALGSPYLFKDMLKFMNGNKQVMVINLHKATKQMDLTFEQFQDMCVLLGCDYCDRIKGIGPKGAYKLIHTHGSLEDVLEFLQDNEKYADIDTDCMITARDYFRTAVQNLDDNTEFVLTDDNFKISKYQDTELTDFMCVKHDFNFEKINKGMERLKKCYSRLHITRSNNKKAHKVLKPGKFTFMVASEDDIDLLPDSEEDTANTTIKIPQKVTSNNKPKQTKSTKPSKSTKPPKSSVTKTTPSKSGKNKHLD